MELEKAKIQQETRLREVDLAISRREGSHDSFEVTKQARLVPKFDEINVDEYFAHFERTALNLGWPRECWSMLLQTVLKGKAQRAYATLPTENCADYNLVKQRFLKASSWFQKLIDRSSEHREKQKTSLMWNFCEKRRMRCRNGVTLRG